MPFVLKGIARAVQNGVWVPTDGLVCQAFKETWFTNPPVPTDPLPNGGVPDGGPVNSGSAFGALGAFQISVPTDENYYIACQTGDDVPITTWEGPKMPTPHTAQQLWTSAATTSVSNLALQKWTVNVASNGVTYGGATSIVANVGATAPTSTGYLMLNPLDVWAYTSYSAGTFSGLTYLGPNSGLALATGNALAQGYKQASSTRRALVFAMISTLVSANNDAAYVQAMGLISGSTATAVQVGVNSWGNSAGTHTLNETREIMLPIDPGSYYGFFPTLAGSGTVTLTNVLEVQL